MKKKAIRIVAMALVLAMSTMVMANPTGAVPQREENSVVYIPLRYAAYAHGFSVSWERETNSAYITSPIWETSFVLPLGELIREAGGFIENGRTWIPYETATAMFGAYSLDDAVVILHINDSHGRILSGGGQFGLYQLAGLKRQFERTGATVLLFDSGDTFHGLPAATLRQGLCIVEMMDAMTHVGVDPIEGITADEIAAVVDGIDIILDGHSHVAIAGSVPVRDDIRLVPHPGTVIASTSGHMREIGVIVIQSGEITSRLVGADTVIPTCEAIYALVYALIVAQDEILLEVVGHTGIELDGSRPNIRTRQTNLGNLAANAMLEASGADVAFINGGGIRDSIAVGYITRHDLVRVFPFGNYVVTLEVPGEAILYALEHGLSAYPGEMGSFLQVAGIKFTFDPDLPVYERITSAYVNGQPLVPFQMYIIATNDYLAAGPRLNGFPVVGNFNALEEILIEHFQDAMGVSDAAR